MLEPVLQDFQAALDKDGFSQLNSWHTPPGEQPWGDLSSFVLRRGRVTYKYDAADRMLFLPTELLYARGEHVQRFLAGCAQAMKETTQTRCFLAEGDFFFVGELLFLRCVRGKRILLPAPKGVKSYRIHFVAPRMRERIDSYEGWLHWATPITMSFEDYLSEVLEQTFS